MGKAARMSDGEAPAWAPSEGTRPAWPARLWAALVEPAAAVAKPEQRRRARLLAAFLVLLLPVCVFTTLVFPWLTLSGWHPWDDLVTRYSLITLAVATVLYGLSRTRWHEAAAHAAVLAATACVWSVTVAGAGTPHGEAAPYFLGLGVLVASVLVPLPVTLGLAGVNMAALWWLPAYLPQLSYFSVSNAFTFLAFQTICIVVVSVSRHQDLRQINAQARHIAESEQRYTDLFETAAEGMLVVEGHRIVDANRAAQAMLGDGDGELSGRRLDEVLPWEGTAPPGESDAPARYEVGLSRPGEPPRFLELIEQGTQWQGRRQRVVSLRDVTDRRQAEETRRAAYERSVELERLQEVNYFKTQLLNTASHELNTPLTALTLQVYNLRLAKVDSSPELRHEIHDVLQRNIDRLSALVRDITDVGRLQSNRMRLALNDVDVAEAVHEAVNAYEALAAENGVRLVPAIVAGLCVRADPMRVSQVLYNLVSNGIKFTPRGGSVTLTAERTHDGVLVRVADTGIGMSKDAAEKLFQPFVQVHDPMKVTKAGSGLGLYICRGIAELHGGELVCESSEPEKGTTFRFGLPWVARAPAPPTPTPATTAAPLPSKP